MARLAVYLLIALDVVLVSWGQQTFEPVIPTFPPPPTMSTVINQSLVVFAGEPVIVGEDVRVTIDCSPQIDAVAAEIGMAPIVRWYKDGTIITPGSAINVEISDNGRFCVITDTLLAVGGQLGTDGNYSCEVCSTPTDCNITDSCNAVCGSPHIMEPIGNPLVSPLFISASCGQDIEVPDLTGAATVLMNCAPFNGSEPLTQQVYKDGELIPMASFPYTIAGAGREAFGTYTFVLSTEKCGIDTAVTRILRQGVPPDIDEGPFIPPPPTVPPGDMEVQIGTPAYVIDGADITLVCDILTGTRPITIMWFRNGVVDPTRGNVSTITVTNYNDGDNYTCRAENDIGFDEESTTINVFEPPQVLPIPIPTAPPGEITVTTGIPSVTTVVTGTPVTIYCPSSGIDTPTIMWAKDGTPITSGGRFTISTTQLGTEPVTSVLEIDAFQPGDVGTYTCTTTNRAGEDTGSTELTQPECAPPAVSSPNPDDPSGPPICADWAVGPFGRCSLECHLGMMTRSVTCVDLNNNNETVADSFCNANTRPEDTVSCGSGPCATGWRKGPWSKCSRTCQTGHQMRVVECTDAGVVVPDDQCDPNVRPVSERFCNGHIACFPCDDEYPEHCKRLMRMPMGCMGDYARKICCWSCRND